MNHERKTILITGGTGYLGSHLVKKVLSEGYKVVVFTREGSNSKRLSLAHNNLLSYKLRTEHYYSDLLLPFNELNIDAVIHCATSYGRCNESEKCIFETNTFMPLQLLEAAMKIKATFINTDTVLPLALNAYALSKHQFKQWGHLLSERDLQFINLRFEHFYGAGDDASKFTSYVVDACLSHQEALALTAGEQLRDFIYVDDAVSAYITILNHLNNINTNYSEYHVGSSQLVTIRQFVEMVKRLTNSTSRLDFGAISYRNNEMMCSDSDPSALRALGWDCNYSLEEGLMKTIVESSLKRE